MSRFNIKDYDELEDKERFSDKKKANHDRRDRQEQEYSKRPKTKPNRHIIRESKGHDD